jgi:serine/threonine-protein kinase
VPKLLDFGLARSADPKKRITKAGRIVGTPGYMAPEQGRGSSELDHRVDIYSLGVTLYEMLSQHLPFAGETARDLVIAAVTEDPPPLSLRKPELEGPIADVVMRAVQRDRENRYPDMRSMRIALVSLLEDDELVPGSSELPFPPQLETGGAAVDNRPPPPARRSH